MEATADDFFFLFIFVGAPLSLKAVLWKSEEGKMKRKSNTVVVHHIVMIQVLIKTNKIDPKIKLT